jgi:hypothetical protein
MDSHRAATKAASQVPWLASDDGTLPDPFEQVVLNIVNQVLKASRMLDLLP